MSVNGFKCGEATVAFSKRVRDVREALEAAEASHVIYTLGFRTETTTDAGPREGGKGKTSIIQKKTLSRGHACTYGGGGESEKLKCTCKWFGDDDFRPCKHHDLPSQFLPRSSWTTQVLCALGVRQQVCAGINAPKSVSAG